MVKAKQVPYLIWYSLKSFKSDLAGVLATLKQPRTWFSIIIVVFTIGVYYRNITLIKVVLPIMFVLYVIRHGQESDFHRAIKERAFLKGKDEEVQKYYERYKRDQYLARKKFVSFKEYKRNEIKEIRKLKEKRHTGSG